ncbi:MAG: GNAT family N-acetyltransferase [Gemmatimonadetes bacterium]|nr:GNAT family N-acetyltransferase [Gemmatimonadota bacterium]
MGGVEVRRVEGRADLERFLRLPWRIYAGDPMWVPPLLSDVRAALDPAKHPFHEHAEVALFLARHGGDVVGRIAAVVNRAHNEFHDDKLGFFGLFECIDDQGVADALLGAAEAWLGERGMTTAQGPMNLSTNEEVCSPGVLIDGWHRPPAVLMGHNPEYYAGLITRAGYAKVKDLLAYWLESETTPTRLQRTYDRMLRDGRVKLRSLDMKRFDDEVAVVRDIYNSAWERNWGFVPMTGAELDYMAQHLKPIAEPKLCVFAEVDGEPVGFVLGLPDYNVALKHVNGRLLPFGFIKLLWHKRKITHCRTITLGLKPGFRGRGLDGLLIAHLFIEAKKVGIWKGECSWILEDNREMRRGLDRIGGVPDKTYRLDEKPLQS